MKVESRRGRRVKDSWRGVVGRLVGGGGQIRHVCDVGLVDVLVDVMVVLANGRVRAVLVKGARLVGDTHCDAGISHVRGASRVGVGSGRGLFVMQGANYRESRSVMSVGLDAVPKSNDRGADGRVSMGESSN